MDNTINSCVIMADVEPEKRVESTISELREVDAIVYVKDAYQFSLMCHRE